MLNTFNLDREDKNKGIPPSPDYEIRVINSIKPKPSIGLSPNINSLISLKFVNCGSRGVEMLHL